MHYFHFMNNVMCMDSLKELSLGSKQDTDLQTQIPARVGMADRIHEVYDFPANIHIVNPNWSWHVLWSTLRP